MIRGYLRLRTSADAVQEHFMTSLDGWRQAPARGVWEPAAGVVLELADEGWGDLLPRALLNGVRLYDRDVRFLLKEVGVDTPAAELDALHDQGRFETLAGTVFAGQPEDLELALELRRRPPPPDEYVPDNETLDALVELADQEPHRPGRARDGQGSS